MKSVLTVLILLGGALTSGYGAPINETKSKLELWAETRQILSKEKNDWVVEKVYLAQSITLLKGEIEKLESTIEDLEQTNTVADEERFDLLQQRGRYQDSNAVSATHIAQLETATLALAKKFPHVLLNKLERLIVRIPENPDDSKLSLGQRLQSVVGILSQAEKFNKSATFTGETRELGNGVKVQVRTLYWGLSLAFYIDMSGEKAGIGVPSDAGWVWTERNDLADDVKKLIDIYEGKTDAIDFVSLPFVIK